MAEKQENRGRPPLPKGVKKVKIQRYVCPEHIPLVDEFIAGLPEIKKVRMEVWVDPEREQEVKKFIDGLTPK